MWMEEDISGETNVCVIVSKGLWWAVIEVKMSSSIRT